MCILIYKYIIGHYLNRIKVHRCLLDATKAFDGIRFGKLFSIPLDRQLPISLVRILLYNYTQQKSRVALGKCKSEYFPMLKQGAIISPIVY